MITTIWAGKHQPELNEALGAWCAAHIGLPRGIQEPFVSLGVMRDDELIAVVVYNNWNPEAGVMEIHGASSDRRWLTRPVLREMHAYPFERAGAQMIVMRMDEDNKSLRRLKDYGFREYVIPRLRGQDRAEVICTLTVEDWRSSRWFA